MTEYSVSFDRVVARHHDEQGEREDHDPRQREARRRGRPLLLAPAPAEELRRVVGARERRLDRRAADREEDPDEREQQTDLAERVLGGHGRRAQELRVDVQRQEERPGDDHQREGEEAAEAVADHRGHLVQAELLQAPAVLDRARRVEVDLVRRHRRAEQADDEVEVDRQAPAHVVARHEAVGDPPPVRVQLDRRDGEDEQAQAEVAEHALDPLEREHPRGADEADHGERDQRAGTAGPRGAACRSRRRPPRPRRSSG